MDTTQTAPANGSGAITTTGSRVAHYAVEPANFSELAAFCDLISKSDLAPKDFRGKPGNVLIAVQMGAEIGLKPMQSLQNIAVINGRPSLWGDAVLALVKQHPLYVSCVESISGEGDAKTATCTMIRKGEQPVTGKFSVLDAKRAGLFSKDGPWKTYPDRMLQMRARSFAARDAFPDALKGLSVAEEAMDIPADAPSAVEPPAASRTEQVLARIRSTTVESATPAPAEATPSTTSATPTPDDNLTSSEQAERAKARDLRQAIVKQWQHVPEPDRKAILKREYGKNSLLDISVSQLEDFLARTPELLPEAAEAQ